MNNKKTLKIRIKFDKTENHVCLIRCFAQMCMSTKCYTKTKAIFVINGSLILQLLFITVRILFKVVS